MRKKVLLIKPPERSFFNFGAFSLGVLASAIRDKADVTIIDATDLSITDTLQTISSYSPHILGITAMGLTSVKPVKLLIEAIKRNVKAKSNGLKETLIIVGGHGASMAYESLLEAGAHAVVIGEGETTFQSIVMNGIETGKEGMACMKGGYLVVGLPQTLIRPLDRLGFPARDLMPLPPDGIHLMETSRGCPHSCGFCETTRFHGRTWRPYSPERVVTEVNNLVNKYNAWIIHFADDNFAANQHRVIDICQGLKKRQLPAFIMVSARADDLASNPEMVQEMASARILRVSVGVETLEPEISNTINKPISIECYKEAFSSLRQHGIFSVASFIIGIPGEKPEMRQRALRLALGAGPDSAHFLPFLPLPGIPLYSGKGLYDPDQEDIKVANELTEKFRNHKTTIRRLTVAAETGGIRGLLAQAALNRQHCQRS
jgi:radical SAM superfamily enzyme YgiQ (UPF0313 family)